MRPNSFKRLHPGDLPLFWTKAEGDILLYTPGYTAFVTSDELNIIQCAFRNAQEGVSSNLDPTCACLKVASKLEEYARGVVMEDQKRMKAPFAPECLTVYLSDQCNLACSYCYARAGPRSTHTDGLSALEVATYPSTGSVKSSSRRGDLDSTGGDGIVDERAVWAAARLVAYHCAEKSMPFHLVLHGGGEPTIHWNLVQRIEEATRQVSNEFGLDWFGYIATNGVMPVERARWLAEHFSLIGLSCDGPPDIQNQQRPLRNGGCSSPFVERTALVLVRSDGNFNVRTTITPGTVSRQSEIAVYLHKQLGATQIRFEPVYLQKPEQEDFAADDADLFVQHFLEAQGIAQELGCELTFSGVRLDETHGPYCNVLRDVLNLTPYGAATACFVSFRGDEPGAEPFIIGRMDNARDEFIIDHERLLELRRLLGDVPDFCKDCFNVYHCSRGCPEVCQVAASREKQEEKPGFRCLVNQKLAEAWILQAALSIRSQERRAESGKPRTDSTKRGGGGGTEGAQSSISRSTDDSIRLEELLADAPPEIEMEAIRCQWRAAAPLLRTVKRSLPLPVWAQRGFTYSGIEAWQMLRQELRDIKPDKALSIYIHIPFCNHKCAFCDCYSRVLSSRSRYMEDEYKQSLLREMELWSSPESLAERAVTTVHFGGGTPNHLSPHVFAQIVEQCDGCFGTNPRTEWAIESTSSLLTGEHLERLRNLGFTRLHVGVQTLEDGVRKLIGRRGGASQVLGSLVRSLDMGFTVSVDIIYGLPGESMGGFAAGLKRLMDIGVHGFSLYQLQTSSQNRRFLERRGVAEREPIYDYTFLQVAEQLLKLNGYHKTYFNHFARSEDRNLYYSFPERDEDLLALGTIADGVFGDYHYRHTDYDNYVSGAMKNIPPLEGGVRETDTERELRPATVALLAGYMKPEILRELNADWFLEHWLDNALLEISQDERNFILTANGSWFITYMILRLSQSICKSPG